MFYRIFGSKSLLTRVLVCRIAKETVPKKHEKRHVQSIAVCVILYKNSQFFVSTQILLVGVDLLSFCRK